MMVARKKVGVGALGNNEKSEGGGENGGGTSGRSRNCSFWYVKVHLGTKGA